MNPEPKRLIVGEGKISGYLSIFLSLISFGAVICFLFPERTLISVVVLFNFINIFSACEIQGRNQWILALDIRKFGPGRQGGKFSVIC